MARTTETPRGERLVKILIHLIRNKGRKYTSNSIQSWLELDEAVDIRNVQRDLKILSEMRYSCVKREQRNGKLQYFIEPDLRNKLTIPIQKNALLSMFMLKQIQPFFAPKTNTLKEMGEALSDLASNEDFELFDNIDQKLDDNTSILGEQSVLTLDDKLLNNLMKSLVEHRVLKILYQKNDGGEPIEREICPAKLIQFHGELFFVSISRKYEDRNFFIKLCRILKAEVTEEIFDVDAKRMKIIEKRLKNSFGIFDENDSKPQKIVLEFPSYFYMLLNEKQYHSSQKVTKTKNGNVRFTMTVPIGRDLIKWIFSWVDKVKIIQPESLKKEVREIAENIVRRYDMLEIKSSK